MLQKVPKLDEILKDEQKTLQIPKHVNLMSLEKITKLLLDIELDKFY